MKKIQLARLHIHAGVSYDVGDVLQVTDANADYMIKNHIGMAVKNKPVTAPKQPQPEAEEKMGATNDEQVNDDSATTTDSPEKQPNEQQGEA